MVQLLPMKNFFEGWFLQEDMFIHEAVNLDGKDDKNSFLV